MVRIWKEINDTLNYLSKYSFKVWVSKVYDLGTHDIGSVALVT